MAENKSQMQDLQARAQSILKQLGIDIPTAIQVLVLAVGSGLVAALLDRILELPPGSRPVLLGSFIAVLNGPTYAYLKKHNDRAGVFMAVVAGIVSLLIWWIVTKIIGEQDMGYNWKYNPADGWNFGQVLLDGVLLGLLGYGWFALLNWLPERIKPKRSKSQ